MVNNKPHKPKQQKNVASKQTMTTAATATPTAANSTNGQQQKSKSNGGNNKKANTNNGIISNAIPVIQTAEGDIATAGTENTKLATTNNSNNSNTNRNTNNKTQQQRNTSSNSNNKSKNSNSEQQRRSPTQQLQQQHSNTSKVTQRNSYAQAVGVGGNKYVNGNNNNKTIVTRTYTNTNTNANTNNNNNSSKLLSIAEKDVGDMKKSDTVTYDDQQSDSKLSTIQWEHNPGDILQAALAAPCAKCFKTITNPNLVTTSMRHSNANNNNINFNGQHQQFAALESLIFTGRQYRKSKSYVGGSRSNSAIAENNSQYHHNANNGNNNAGGGGRHVYQRSYSDRRSSFDRNFAERNKGFVPIIPPARPVLSSSNIAAVIADTEKLTIIERVGKGRTSYPIMQCGTLDAPDSSYHQQRSNRMDVYQIDDGFHSDGGTETPPPSPSSGSSIASTSDHGSLESVDTGGTQRLAVLSFEQVRKLHNVMDEKVAIHGRGNFPTLEVTLKDLVNSVRRKLEADVSAGGAGVIVKDIRLNGGAASHVLASEDQPYNDLDLIYAIELTSTRHFDRVKTAVLNTLLDLLPEGVSKRRIMPCALKEAYVGKMVKVNNNNDGDRWSLISLGNSPGHKNVELKFVDTMRRQFEFSVDSFQIVLDSLLLFYDCAALPISENFYPTVVGESVYGDFQEALYHLQKKLISTRQPEEIRGGGLLKYCNLLVRNYKPVDPQRIKTLERYMCSRFFIDFPDINTQTVKLEAYLRNHFWGESEEPLQYQYLMHLREVVEMSTVCLMGHERRQTLLLIQSLAAQVLYKEQHKQQQAAQDQYHQHQQQQQQTHELQQQQQQQQQQTVTLLATTATQSQQQQQQQQPQTIYVQQAGGAGGATICCTLATSADQQQQQQQGANATNAAANVPQTIQIQAGPPGLIYANGVYYAPVIPTAICTCNSTWLST